MRGNAGVTGTLAFGQKKGCNQVGVFTLALMGLAVLTIMLCLARIVPLSGVSALGVGTVGEALAADPLSAEPAVTAAQPKEEEEDWKDKLRCVIAGKVSFLDDGCSENK